MAPRLSELLNSTVINIKLVQQDEVKLASDFQLDTQKRSQWCWVAVAIGVARYLRAPKLVEDQCALAGHINECPDCKDPLCNATGDVDAALVHQGVDANPESGAPGFDYLFREVGEDRPVVCDMTDRDSGFHSVVVCRCYRDGRKIDMLDPRTDRANGYIGSWESYHQPYDGIVDLFDRYFTIEDPRP